MDEDSKLAKLLQEQEELMFRHTCENGKSFGSCPTASEQSRLDLLMALRVQREEDLAYWQCLTGSRTLGPEMDGRTESMDINSLSYEALQNLGEMVGTVSKGLDDVDIMALRSQEYSCSSTHKHDQCAICQAEFENKEIVTSLPCNHSYHPDCIKHWLTINKVCPICNSEVLPRISMPKD